MRQAITALAVFSMALVACNVSSFDFDGSQFRCTPEAPDCPAGQACIDNRCTVICDVPSTHGSIGAALESGCPVATVADGVFQENIVIDRDFELIGSGATTIDGGGLASTITVSSGTVVLRDLDIVGGFAHRGGGIANAGDLTLESVTVSGNIASGEVSEGAGIHSSAGGSLTISLSSIINNRVESLGPEGPLARGGGIYTQSPLTMTDTLVANNTATAVGSVGDFIIAHGAGVYVRDTTASLGSGTEIIDNVTSSTVAETDTNLPLSAGAGLYNRGSMVTVTDAVISGNTARSEHGIGRGAVASGGGIIVDDAVLHLVGSTISNNRAEATGAENIVAEGGAIYAGPRCEVNAETTTISMNVASTTETSSLPGGPMSRGGALALSDATALSLTNATVSGNEANAPQGQCRGGAIWIQSRSAGFPDLTMRVETTTIADNRCQALLGRGGGLALRADDIGIDATFRQSAIVRNTLEALGGDETLVGGGIALFGDQDGRLVVGFENSTISGNAIVAMGGANGGGIVVSPNPSGTALDVSLVSTTITRNTITGVVGSGGGLAMLASPGPMTVSLANSIVAGNAAGEDSDCASGTVSIVGGGSNVINATVNCLLATTRANLQATDPGLSPLADNGGPTLTHALEALSPARDNGDPEGCLDLGDEPLAIDQRGMPRIDACDVGAFEEQ